MLKEHLSLWGVGPLYVASITVITVIALYLHYGKMIPVLTISSYCILFFRLLGGMVVVVGSGIWVKAVFVSRITRSIRENHLITDGVYGIVRHPIYSAFTLVEWGILLFAGNGWLLILIPVYWCYLTILIKNTEEKWLLQLYGKEYEEYCKKVNRCIPWFPRK